MALEGGAMEKGHLVMSAKELSRKSVFERVQRGELSRTDASVLLGLSYRQCMRILARFWADGDAGLVHRGRGRCSNRQHPEELKQAVLVDYGEHLLGFGPTLAAEKLAERGLVVDHETLRRWLLDADLWHRERRSQKHRSRRERRAHFGELVQMDGSPHHWFGPDGEEYELMNMVDDATGCTMALLSKGETVEAAMQILWAWIERFGIPQALYVDRKNIYKATREPTLAEQLSGEVPMTHFEKACHKLGICIIQAHSPQAKGRVERNHGVYQDRLVKELALQGIKTLEGANALLRGGFCDALNDKFARAPREQADYHRTLPKGMKLQDVFVYEETRCVDNDWTVSYCNQRYQISANNRPLPQKGGRVLVRRALDGALSILYQGKKVRFCLAPAPSKPACKCVVPKQIPKSKRRAKPDRNHPWRRSGA
jgi:transposase-like protein